MLATNPGTGHRIHEIIRKATELRWRTNHGDPSQCHSQSAAYNVFTGLKGSTESLIPTHKTLSAVSRDAEDFLDCWVDIRPFLSGGSRHLNNQVRHRIFRLTGGITPMTLRPRQLPSLNALLNPNA